MALVEMVMPKMGESVMEGTILNWLKKVGETIAQDEPVIEVATDKVDTEIPATHAGILKEILVQVGDVVQVGKPIAIINTSAADDSPSPKVQPATEKVQQTLAKPEPVLEMAYAGSNGNGSEANYADSDRFYSPLVLNMARQENISMTELSKIKGTGKDGRVTKNDMQNYLSNRPAYTIVANAPVEKVIEAKPTTQTSTSQLSAKVETTVESVKPAVSFSGKHEIIEMDRMRKMIAQRMVDSVHISPHVTSFVEADMTNIVRWRSGVADSFKKKEGYSITFTTIFMMAVAKALREMPLMNSSVEGDKIIVKKDINVGMAVALPTDNLIVPVIKNADMLNMVGMAYQVNDLAKRARENKLKPDELSGGTYTVSNIGSFGNMLGTPIIMQPQVGILSLGAIIKKPAVIETPEGDMIGIRHMMFLSHSYDHRIVDGALGGRFVRRVADLLEKFDTTQKL